MSLFKYLQLVLEINIPKFFNFTVFVIQILTTMDIFFICGLCFCLSNFTMICESDKVFSSDDIASSVSLFLIILY